MNKIITLLKALVNVIKVEFQEAANNAAYTLRR